MPGSGPGITNAFLSRSVNTHNSIAISSRISHEFRQSRPAHLKSQALNRAR